MKTETHDYAIIVILSACVFTIGHSTFN